MEELITMAARKSPQGPEFPAVSRMFFIVLSWGS
jgi:hypothetical protein